MLTTLLNFKLELDIVEHLRQFQCSSDYVARFAGARSRQWH